MMILSRKFKRRFREACYLYGLVYGIGAAVLTVGLSGLLLESFSLFAYYWTFMITATAWMGAATVFALYLTLWIIERKGWLQL